MSSSLGAPDPLGVTLEAEGANIAVYSANATAIEFCLFDAKGDAEAARLALPGRSGAIFHGFIAGSRRARATVCASTANLLPSVAGALTPRSSSPT
ncbi:MAG TPA: hypothetical protein VEC58_07730, partial [Roseiarcus sp.]|nr:hypothetical protein [Roseiarcus sp.]